MVIACHCPSLPQLLGYFGGSRYSILSWVFFVDLINRWSIWICWQFAACMFLCHQGRNPVTPKTTRLGSQKFWNDSPKTSQDSRLLACLQSSDGRPVKTADVPAQSCGITPELRAQPVITPKHEVQPPSRFDDFCTDGVQHYSVQSGRCSSHQHHRFVC